MADARRGTTLGWRLGLLLILALTAVTCAPASPPAAGPGDASTRPAPSRTLVMVVRGEPPNLGAVKVQAASPAGREVARLFYATLDYADERGLPRPYLAEAVPTLNSDSWRVYPDGGMETTYTLRPNLTWHDGTPLSAEDFAFAGRVYAAPPIGVAGTPPISEIAEVSARDSRTVAIRWRSPFPDAAALFEDFQPLPRHILEAAFQEGDLEAFANHPYWTFQYVGLGPYRLDRWEPGSSIVGTAFAGHALGRPKIDRVSVMFMPDANSALAAILSGEIHIVIDSLVRTTDAPLIQSNGGKLVVSPVSFRLTQFQFRPEMGALPELQDVRVRAAIAHALDKHSINQALFAGQALVSDSFVSPAVAYYPAVDRAITRYPYDLRRSPQLLEEAGLGRSSDGFFGSPGSDSLKLEVRIVAGAENETENAIIVEGFRRAGLNASPYLFPVAQLRDAQAVTTFPALFSTGRSGEEKGLGDYSLAAIPKAENRWLGGNRGGFIHQEYDRLWQAYNSTLDRSERTLQIAQMERILSEQLPAIPHYYAPRAMAHVAGLRGPAARFTRYGGENANIHQWEWLS
jgi:peptide/nickel transport system substrate-binding protein